MTSQIFTLLVLLAATATGQPLSNVECPNLPACCDEDCCAERTTYTSEGCVPDPDSQGFTGAHSPDYKFGCAVRQCCESDCCAEGTTYDLVSQFCVPVFSNLDDTFKEEAESKGGVVEETSTGYVLSFEDEDSNENTSLVLIETPDHVSQILPSEPQQCPFCADCGCDECPSGRRELNFERDIVGTGDRDLSIISCLSNPCSAWRCKEALLPALPLLPACPCFQAAPGPGVTAPAGWEALAAAWQRFHPGANHCMRSTTVGVLPQFGQQCCYTAAGALITGGRAAGTPDRYSPGNAAGFAFHQCEDVAPFFACSCSTYLANRPPNVGVGCAVRNVNPC